MNVRTGRVMPVVWWEQSQSPGSIAPVAFVFKVSLVFLCSGYVCRRNCCLASKVEKVVEDAFLHAFALGQQL